VARTARRVTMTGAPPTRRARVGHAWTEPDHGAAQPGHGAPEPDLGPAQPGHGAPEPDHGGAWDPERWDQGWSRPDHPRARPELRRELYHGHQRAGRKARGRRRRGRLVLLVVVVLLGGAAGAVAFGGRSLVPLLGRAAAPGTVALSDAPGRVAAVAGNPDGRWTVAPGNATFVGFRVREKFGALPAPNDAVGRSPAVVGGMTIRDGKVTAALVTGDLRQLRSDKARRDDVIRTRGLETNLYPAASFQLTRPVDLVAARIAYGRVADLDAAGTLTLHGVTRQVRLPLRSRWGGDTLQVVGRLPVKFADFRIQPPSVAGFVTVQPLGWIELNLVFRRS
jgi:polyisoprenoid-binding protein YceI